MNTYLVRAECAKSGCNIRSASDRRKKEFRAYEGELEAHQLILVPLYGHTAHGGCGLNVKVDGERILG